jgi:hypothetical protein
MSKTQDKVQALYRFECTGCKRFHEQLCHPNEFGQHFDSWVYKHSGPLCDIKSVKLWHVVPRDFSERNWIKKFTDKFGDILNNFVMPWYLRTWEFQENNNFQLAYTASQNLTFNSLNSLGSDTSLLAGGSSSGIDNGASATLLDLGLTGKIQTGTSPTVSKEIDVWAWSTIDDTPTYPDVINGLDSLKTVTSTNVLNNAMSWVTSITNDSNSNRNYPVKSTSLEAIFGGFIPRYWGLWVVQNTGANLASGVHQFTTKQSYIVG